MVHEFRLILLGVDIAWRIKKKQKRWTETNNEFLDGLLADALERGKTVPVNARHAIVTFVGNANVKFTDFLETKVNLDSEQPEEELKLAVSVLAQQAEMDGRLPERTKLKAPVAAATAHPVKADS